jgi:hypothetical protein
MSQNKDPPQEKPHKLGLFDAHPDTVELVNKLYLKVPHNEIREWKAKIKEMGYSDIKDFILNRSLFQAPTPREGAEEKSHSPSTKWEKCPQCGINRRCQNHQFLCSCGKQFKNKSSFKAHLNKLKERKEEGERIVYSMSLSLDEIDKIRKRRGKEVFSYFHGNSRYWRERLVADLGSLNAVFRADWFLLMCCFKESKAEDWVRNIERVHHFVRDEGIQTARSGSAPGSISVSPTSQYLLCSSSTSTSTSPIPASSGLSSLPPTSETELRAASCTSVTSPLPDGSLHPLSTPSTPSNTETSSTPPILPTTFPPWVDFQEN